MRNFRDYRSEHQSETSKNINRMAKVVIVISIIAAIFMLAVIIGLLFVAFSVGNESFV